MWLICSSLSGLCFVLSSNYIAGRSCRLSFYLYVLIYVCFSLRPRVQPYFIALLCKVSPSWLARPTASPSFEWLCVICIKLSFNGFCRLETAEEIVIWKITQWKLSSLRIRERKKKTLKINAHRISNLWNNINHLTICSWVLRIREVSEE